MENASLLLCSRTSCPPFVDQHPRSDADAGVGEVEDGEGADRNVIRHDAIRNAIDEITDRSTDDEAKRDGGEGVFLRADCDDCHEQECREDEKRLQ